MMRPNGFAFVLVGMMIFRHPSVAQDTPPAADTPASSPAAGESVTPKSLRDDQLAVSGRYSRFERMLTQMADILGRQDPERADLLRRAIGKGREGRIKEEIENVVASD